MRPLAPWKLPHMRPQDDSLDTELGALVGMLEPGPLRAFTDAVVRHFLSVADQWPASLQDHILRLAYLTWCRKRSLPYVAISSAQESATLLLDISHIATDLPFDLGAYFLSKVEPCSVPETVSCDPGGRFIAALPPSCATGLARDLYSVVAVS